MQYLDIKLQALLEEVAQDPDGQLWIHEADYADHPNLGTIERALRRGLVEDSPDGGMGGYRQGIRLTEKGWSAIGIAKPPSALQRLLRALAKILVRPRASR